MKTNFRKCAPTIPALFLLFAFSCTNYQIPDNGLPDDPGKELPQVVESNCYSDTVYFQNTILPLHTIPLALIKSSRSEPGSVMGQKTTYAMTDAIPHNLPSPKQSGP
jgi:hypothetical protein